MSNNDIIDEFTKVYFETGSIKAAFEVLKGMVSERVYSNFIEELGKCRV